MHGPVLLTYIVAGQFTSETEIEIGGINFRFNGRLTYENYKPEARGRLMNVRMVNSVFDDENPATQPSGYEAIVSLIGIR